MAVIACRYSCDTCAVSRVVIKVPGHTNDDWDAWVAAMLAAMQTDHLSRSNLGATCPGSLVEIIIGLNPDA